jgi:hypothetical protein
MLDEKDERVTNSQLILKIQELELELQNVKKERDHYKWQAKRTRKMLDGVKLNNGALTIERNKLVAELNSIKAMSMFEFSSTYGTPEQQEADGKAFAKALLGGV